MNTLEAIEKRWGCRKYSDDSVDREVLGAILDAGRLAPSAGNLQDRSFIIVKNSELKSDIAKASGNQTWMQSAPVLIIIVAENKKNGKFFGPKGEKIYSIQDTAFATENMLLAATDLGLGCSLVIGFNEDKIKELLKIEPPAEPYSIIVLGHAAEQPKTSSKYPLEKFVFFEKYGSKIVDMDSSFGEYQKVKEKVASHKNDIMKGTSGFLDKILSLFKGKKQQPQMEDHFMEESPVVEEKQAEIPRQLPRK